MVRIDCKGNVVLADFGDTAVLARMCDKYTPFVVARGYDRETGSWSFGTYYNWLLNALLDADPDIVSSLSEPVTHRDIASLMTKAGYTAKQSSVFVLEEELERGLFFSEQRDSDADVEEVAAAADSLGLDLATDTCDCRRES